ncbi:ClpX C4-type zinc finger protein [Sphingomonas sp. BK069]|uniref:ClpX C4-type zinc finger protein n=1 Tax=Sphingomonas sp. BK069 TaxID=2586979 RepID=UPI0018351454|nr:hypothetical protein [Sphingomonas sp. BK069]
MISSIRCSFCAKSDTEVKRIVAGPHSVFICNECVSLCALICLGADEGATQVGRYYISTSKPIDPAAIAAEVAKLMRPQLTIMQWSADGETCWSDRYFDGAFFSRTSDDHGETWSDAEPMRAKA